MGRADGAHGCRDIYLLRGKGKVLISFGQSFLSCCLSVFVCPKQQECFFFTTPMRLGVCVCHFLTPMRLGVCVCHLVVRVGGSFSTTSPLLQGPLQHLHRNNPNGGALRLGQGRAGPCAVVLFLRLRGDAAGWGQAGGQIR